jgi:hypothetical protein
MMSPSLSGCHLFLKKALPFYWTAWSVYTRWSRPRCWCTSARRGIVYALVGLCCRRQCHIEMQGQESYAAVVHGESCLRQWLATISLVIHPTLNTLSSTNKCLPLDGREEEPWIKQTGILAHSVLCGFGERTPALSGGNHLAAAIQAKILFSVAGIVRCECVYTPAIFAATRSKDSRDLQVAIHPSKNNHPLQTTMIHRCTACFQQGIINDFPSSSNMRSHLGAPGSHNMGPHVCQVNNCGLRTHRMYVYNDSNLQASG